MTTAAELEFAISSDRSRPAFDWLFPVLLGGYMLMGKSFAWLHIPGTPLFIGELVLAFGLAGAFRVLTWQAVWTRSSVPGVLAVYVAWGLARTIPGLMDDPIPAVRDAVLWIYVIVAWAVVGAVAARPHALVGWLTQYVRVMPFAVLWLPTTLFLSTLDIGTVPDSTVPLTSFDGGMMQIQLLLIIGFLWLVWNPKTLNELRWRTAISGVAMIGILALATRNRGGFVGAMVGLAVVLLFHDARTKLVITAARVLLITVVLVLVFDPRVDVGERELSADQFSENIASIVGLEANPQLEGNVSWRLRHWSDIFEGVNRNAPVAGHGFGPNIAEIYAIPQTDIGLRNAHNSHLTLFARAGWVGFILWATLWWVWYAELNRARRRFRDTDLRRLSGMCAWAMAGTIGFHLEAVFNPSIEGPQTAFWLWALFGLGMYLIVISHRGRPGEVSAGWHTDAAALNTALDGIGRR